MIKSVNTIGKVLLTSFLVVVALVALAEEGKGDKKGDKNKNGATQTSDTVDQVLLDVKAANQVDDTLVFEDWDSPDGNGDKGDGDFKSSDDGQGDNDDTGGDTPPSPKSSSKLPDGLATFKQEYRVEFSVYPNPAMNTLNINPDKEPETFIIKDIQGRIFHKDVFVPRVDISNLANGTYFIQLVYADQHVESRKFIKH